MTEYVAPFFIGLGLAASVGFRIFLPLLALSAASYFDIIPVDNSFAWISTFPAMIALGAATLLETLAYFIPWFDNLLDTIALPTATIAGTAVMASTLIELDPLWQWALAIIAGGGTAGLVKGVSANTRLASTATTGGLANPIVTTVETAASAGLSALSVFLWPIAAIVVIGLLVLVVFFFKKLRQLWRRPSSKSSVNPASD
ncbi:MAG: DUF4126 domain-containing protein [Tunicatimonas sp.]|uniref:DUF4126 domain-containing protein n=1 Tax=Tunicatimonas sp. TaxID=1940096 RepID=UPI003C73E29C